MTPLRLTTFGRCELRRAVPDGGFEAVPLAGKALGLLVRLASATDQPLSRDVLANELWSDLDRERAQAQFRTALWTLKKQLPPDAIRADDSTVALAASLAVDRTEFQAAVRAGDYTTATALYHGDFLANFAVSGARGFEEWVDVERRNLRGLFIGAAAADAQRLIRSARFADAVALASRARDAEPLDQAPWRALLQALISAGDTVTARAEAAAFLALHDDEQFAIEPETTRLLKLASASVPAAPSADGTPGLEAELVGRERELAGLLDLMDRARRGHALAATVIGPPGIGKTRLLRDFGRSAAAHRATVVAVSAPRATQRVPYGTLARLAERLASLRGALGVSAASAAVLVGLHPTLSTVYRSVTPLPIAPDHGTRLLALVELINAVSEETTLVIVVDDAQWLDDSSRELVQALPESCADASLLLVMSARSVATAPDYTGASLFTLGPLSPSLTESMVGSIARLPDERWTADWIRALHDAARGIPLGVLDVTRLAVERGAVEIHDGAWRCSDPAALLRLTESAAPREARIAQLPDAARQLAITLALAGGSVDTEVAADVLELSLDGLAEAAQPLIERGIGQVDGTTLGLAHDEYSAAAIALVWPDDRRKVRARIATQMERRGDVDSLRRAYALAEDAEDGELAGRIAERYVTVARKRAPRLDARAAMAELIGIGARATRLDELLSRHDGARRTRRRLLALAAAVVLVATGLVAAPLVSRRAASPDAIVSLDLTIGDSHLVTGVPISLSDWSTTRPIVIDARLAYAIGNAATRTIVRSPTDTAAWVGVESRNDRVTDDIVILRHGAPPRYVASSHGDDIGPTWSPNGNRVAFITARWSGDRADIAIADLRTDSVARVVAGTGVLGAVVFRGDGAGVAFLRHDARTHAADVCALSLAERAPRCRALPADASITSLAWPSASTVYLAQTNGLGQGYLLAWDLAMDSMRSVAGCLGPAISVDALGGFIVCTGSERSPGVSIAPLARPDQMRRVEIIGIPSGAAGNVSVVSLNRPRAMGKLRLTPAHDPVAGIAHQLRAVLPIDGGDDAQPAAVSWTVAQGDAKVTEGGTLLARKPGVVTLVASDGLATDTLHVTVRAPVDSQVLDERWTPDWRARWMSFGAPLPEVVDALGKRAFLNNGDGIYFSGAYTRAEWDLRAGLAADFDLSTPLTADTSQLVRIGLRTGGDSAVMAGWDHRTGYGPGISRQRWCKFQFPTGMFRPAQSKFSGAGPEQGAPPLMRGGALYHVRVQYFPDGRCGVAVNGTMVGIVPSEGAMEPTARMYIDGSTVKTTFLVFGITVRRGVPGGVDWRAGK